MKFPPIHLFLTTTLCLFGCTKDLENKLLREKGSLTSPSGQFVAKVDIPDQIVKIKIESKQNGEEVFQATSGNIYHRWFLMWDENDRLWNWNSDVGGDLIYQEGKIWKRDRDPDYSEAPIEFFQSLPNLIKNKDYNKASIETSGSSAPRRSIPRR